MTDREALLALACLVRQMRDAQRAYFRTRSTADLGRSKGLERAVDHRIEEILDDQPRLSFGG